MKFFVIFRYSIWIVNINEIVFGKVYFIID